MDAMNAAEIKLDLFRRIDSLKEPELEKVYKKLLALLGKPTDYCLSDIEKKAIDEALTASERGEVYSYDKVMKVAKQKHPNLRFK
jgi:hypothetical protein